MLRRIVKKSIDLISSNNYLTLNNIYINSSRVLNNLAVVQKLNSKNTIIPVLKANAYGHGLIEITKILNEADVSFIAVDGYFEAAKIRDITNHKILVMGYILPANMKLIDIKKCSFVIQDIDGLAALSKLDKPVNIHLELNTGMNRLGLNNSEINQFLNYIEKHTNLILEGVMTHLADADNEYDDSYTKNQFIKFDREVENIIKRGFKPKYIHIAQTAGSVKAISKYANAIRLGIGLYGLNPLGPKDNNFNRLNELQPVLELRSTIIKCVELEKGDRVSYNGIFTAPKKMRIGILPIGYYEGIPRNLSNRGFVTYKKTKQNIVGRVCMNHTMIDLTDSMAKINNEVVIISNDKTADNSVINLCQKFDLFSYTLVTGLSNSVRRNIV